MLSNFWALSIAVLIWINLVATVASWLAQIDIPEQVWGQYPLILIGVVLVAALARYWVANEREWRVFVVEQQKEQKADQLRVLQLIQTNGEQQIKIIGDNHKDQIALIEKNHQEQLKLQREGLRDTFDSEIERVLDLLAKSGYYDKKSGRAAGDQS